MRFAPHQAERRGSRRRGVVAGASDHRLRGWPAWPDHRQRAAPGQPHHGVMPPLTTPRQRSRKESYERESPRNPLPFSSENRALAPSRANPGLSSHKAAALHVSFLSQRVREDASMSRQVRLVPLVRNQAEQRKPSSTPTTGVALSRLELVDLRFIDVEPDNEIGRRDSAPIG